jgi:hypothetical protein
MDLPNYRQRYYEARFSDEVAAGKGVDAIAASVCRHYVVGCNGMDEEQPMAQSLIDDLC